MFKLDKLPKWNTQKKNKLLMMLLWLLSWFTAFDSGPLSQVVNYISIVTHFENFSKGVLDSKDVVFYLSMIFFSLFITSRAMESLRWRS